MIDIIEKLNAAKEMLKKDPPSDMRFRPSFELAQKEAAREIEPLTTKLVDAVAAISVPVFINGTNAQILAERASDETPAAIVSVNGLYDNVINEVRQSIGRSREFGVSQFVIVMRNIRSMAEKSGLHSIANVSFGEPVIVKDDQHLAALVVEYAERIAGADLAVNYVRKVAATQAAERVDSKIPVFPVFIVNSTPELRTVLGNKLFKAKSIDYSAPADLTKDSALEMLKELKKTLKGK